MSDRRHLLLDLLRRPEGFGALSLEQWDLAVRQARRAGVLARIAFLLEDGDRLAEVPEGPLQHLLAARTLALKHVRDVRWEVICVTRVLADLEVPITLLKGAAYVFAELPPARGRLFADIDFMVPKDRIAAVEKALLRSEWLTDVTDAYDQRYYRQWTHQIPPLRHDRRQTVLDVHHTIVQPTARASVEPEPLVAASRTLDVAGLRILAPTDMVLHSAVHLFNEGEFDRGLRDLLDLSDLLRHFGADPGFWEALPQRAEDLGLTGPLYLTFRYLRRFLDVPIPPKALSAAERWQPGTVRRALFDQLLERALLPDHKSCDGRLTPLARWLLYARAHYLRMPFALLLPHLVRKAVHRSEEE